MALFSPRSVLSLLNMLALITAIRTCHGIEVSDAGIYFNNNAAGGGGSGGGGGSDPLKTENFHEQHHAARPPAVGSSSSSNNRIRHHHNKAETQHTTHTEDEGAVVIHTLYEEDPIIINAQQADDDFFSEQRNFRHTNNATNNNKKKSFSPESLLFNPDTVITEPDGNGETQLKREARAAQQLQANAVATTPAGPTAAPKRAKYGNNAPYTETQILDLLFQNYDKRVRPAGLTANGTKGPVYVEVNVLLRSISKVDDVKMEYTAQITFREMWKDERLAFDDGGYHSYLTLPDIGKVWKPDLFFYPEKEGWFHKIVTPNWMFRIYPDGTVLYSVRLSLVLSCFMRLHYYPMDRQNCTIDMASYAYTTKDIVFQWRNDSPVQIKNIHLPQFTLEKWEVSECTTVTNTGGYSCIQVVLFFRREFSYYLLQVYVPTIMLVIVSWVSFWLDQDAIPARITLGVTTLLTMATSQSGINAALPPVSYTKAIDIWTGTCTALIFGALLEFALVNYASRKESAREKRKHQLAMAKRARRMDAEMALAANEHGSFANPFGTAGGDDGNGGGTIKLLEDVRLGGLFGGGVGGVGVGVGGDTSFDAAGPLLRNSLSRSGSNAGNIALNNNNNNNNSAANNCACDERTGGATNTNTGSLTRQQQQQQQPLFITQAQHQQAAYRQSIADLNNAVTGGGLDETSSALPTSAAHDMFGGLVPPFGGASQPLLQGQLSNTGSIASRGNMGGGGGGGGNNRGFNEGGMNRGGGGGNDGDDDSDEEPEKTTWCWGLCNLRTCFGHIKVPKSKARKIDFISRLLFPLIFFIFNIAYWTHCYEARLDTIDLSH